MPASLERIYDEHARALFSFLLNFTRSEPDTRDVLQEVFGKIAARPRLLNGVRDERAFLLYSDGWDGKDHGGKLSLTPGSTPKNQRLDILTGIGPGRRSCSRFNKSLLAR